MGRREIAKGQKFTLVPPTVAQESDEGEIDVIDFSSPTQAARQLFTLKAMAGGKVSFPATCW